MKEMLEDELLGKYIYCTQHLRVHSTGWCTVCNDNKFPLNAQTLEDAVQEAITKGYLTSEGEGILFIYDYKTKKLVKYDRNT